MSQRIKDHHHIVIIGNVATGKSTLMHHLGQLLQAKTIPADDLYLTNPFFPLAVRDRARWSLTSDLWFLHERVKITRSIPDLLKKQSVVVDSGVLMSYVYASSRKIAQTMTSEEWNFYHHLYQELVATELQPDLVIFLTSPVEVLLQRIDSRGRQYERDHYTREYLLTIEKSLTQAVQLFKKQNLPVIEIESNQMNPADLLKNPQLQPWIEGGQV